MLSTAGCNAASQQTGSAFPAHPHRWPGQALPQPIRSPAALWGKMSSGAALCALQLQESRWPLSPPCPSTRSCPPHLIPSLQLVVHMNTASFAEHSEESLQNCYFFPFYLKGGSSRRNQDGVVKAPEAEIADLAPHLMATIAHSGQLSLLAELTDSSLSFPSRDPGLGNHCPKSAISLLLPPDNGLCVGVSHVRLVVPAKFLCD